MASCYTPDRTPGGVAESADAPDLKSGGRKVVWVRVPPPLLSQNACKWAQNQNKRNRLSVLAGPIYTTYYTNALRKGVFHRIGGALLHGR
jgi:hypothetical protein